MCSLSFVTFPLCSNKMTLDSSMLSQQILWLTGSKSQCAVYLPPGSQPRQSWYSRHDIFSNNCMLHRSRSCGCVTVSASLTLTSFGCDIAWTETLVHTKQIAAGSTNYCSARMPFGYPGPPTTHTLKTTFLFSLTTTAYLAQLQPAHARHCAAAGESLLVRLGP